MVPPASRRLASLRHQLAGRAQAGSRHQGRTTHDGETGPCPAPSGKEWRTASTTKCFASRSRPTAGRGPGRTRGRGHGVAAAVGVAGRTGPGQLGERVAVVVQVDADSMSPRRCPPLTSTCRARARAASSPPRTAPPGRARRSRPAGAPRRGSGSRRSARGNSRVRYASSAFSASSGSPCMDAATGSTTNGVGPRAADPLRSHASATARMISVVASIPVLPASSPMSVATASICAATVSGGTVCTPVTPTVFCTVTAVTATQPCTPHAGNVRRSAATSRAPAGVRARDRHRPRRGGPDRALTHDPPRVPTAAGPAARPGRVAGRAEAHHRC